MHFVKKTKTKNAPLPEKTTKNEQKKNAHPRGCDDDDFADVGGSDADLSKGALGHLRGQRKRALREPLEPSVRVHLETEITQKAKHERPAYHARSFQEMRFDH